jgi:hypothetical protein
VTTRLPVTLCPECGYTLDSADSLETDAKPTVGDFTVCMACTCVLRFDAQLRPRSVSAELLRRECARDPDLKRSLAQTVAAVRIMHHQLGKPGRNAGKPN